MKKVSYIFFLSFVMLALYIAPANAQWTPPGAEVAEVVIPATPIGQLELIINSDTIEGGARINPNRVYVLQKDSVYIQQAAIKFEDTTATLIIRGEEGGNMPIVLSSPLEGVDRFRNDCNGDLSLENVYWPAQHLNGNGWTLFRMLGSTARIELTKVITENARSDVFGLRDVKGKVSLFIKNSYFRDLSQLSNSWNYVVFARGNDGEPFDTLWIENTTISNGGMPLFGKNTSCNVFYMNHVTFYNSTKYPNWLERFGEAYFVNTLYLNANWEGECRSTWETQVNVAAPGDIIMSGQIRFDTIVPEMWVAEAGPAPAQADVKILAASNLNWVSQLLVDDYYAGKYNTVGDKPISNRTWGSVTEADIPLFVENLPVKMFSAREEALIADWPNIKVRDNWDLTTDPGMKTQSPADAAAATEFAHFARQNYSVADEGEEHDRTKIWFGDGDVNTIPGGGTENGGGMPDVTGMPEDFSYTNMEVMSTIDGLPLGDLSWWPDHLASWDTEARFAEVKHFHEIMGATAIIDKEETSDNLFSLYPNPARDVLTISSQSELNHARFFNVTGKLVLEINLNGAFTKDVDVSGLDNGLYILQVKDVTGQMSSLKFQKQ